MRTGRFTVCLLGLICIRPLEAQSGQNLPTTTVRKSARAALWWSLFVPGGGHYYLGETKLGFNYLMFTGSLVGWGLSVEGRRVSGELNTPLLYAQQVHVTQIYTAYRRAIKLEFPEKTRYHNKILQEHSGLSALLQAPFKRENLTNPWVVSFALLGAGLNYAGIRFAKTERDFWNMRQVQILGDRFNREVGFGIYSAYWLPVSLGAAVSEESLFRGMVQSEWEDRWGKRKGWMFASALFGLAHYDGTGQSLGNMLFAAMAGLFLGWRFQQRDYHLSEPIAEHFWFNALAGVTLYLADPENNPLGAKVEFAF